MRLIIEERGTELTLTADEQLSYDAIIREGRLPGDAVRSVDEPSSREAKQPGRGGRGANTL